MSLGQVLHDRAPPRRWSLAPPAGNCAIRIFAAWFAALSVYYFVEFTGGKGQISAIRDPLPMLAPVLLADHLLVASIS